MGSKETLKRRVTEVVNKKVLEINGRNHVHEIPGKMEQQFFLFLLEQFSSQGASVVYEPHSFKIYDRNGKAESTTPDFLIKTSDGICYYIEITTRELNGRDPKGKQRRIMSHFPDKKYSILYREDLKRIQEENPQFSFWRARKTKR